MLPALMFSGMLVVAAAEPAAPASSCAVVKMMKSKALPANSSDPQAGVVHGALLYYGDSFAGALYGTRGGTIFYQPKLAGNAADDASRKRAMSTLGISSPPSSQAPVEAPKPNIVDLLAPDVRLKGCF